MKTKKLFEKVFQSLKRKKNTNSINTPDEQTKYKEHLKQYLGNVETKTMSQDYQHIMKSIYSLDKINHKAQPETQNKSEKQVLEQLEKERETIQSNFFNANSLKILQNTNNEHLLDLACKSFVGDTDVPKDAERSLIILKMALDKCRNEEEKQETKFFLDYFGKHSEIDSVTNPSAANIFNDKDYYKARYVTSRELFKIITYNFMEIQGQESISQEEKDFHYTKIYYMMEEAADKGIYEAYYFLGLMNLNGLYTKVNKVKAFYFFSIAASYSHALAYYQLYQMLKENMIEIYENEDIKRAAIFDYLKLSAEEGYIEAMYELGNDYLHGTHTKPNKLKALAWHRQACRNGYPLSYVLLTYLL